MEQPTLHFEHQQAWKKWLERNQTSSSGVWLHLAKKGSAVLSVSYGEALDVALCFGWIDGQKKAHDKDTFLQKFTPRSKRSIWSKINVQKALGLMESGQMRAAGLIEIERARQDGRWEAAYDSHRTATVPADLQEALDQSAKAKAFFATLNSQNRYAILFRLQTAKLAETRARRIRQFIAMLERQETLH